MKKFTKLIMVLMISCLVASGCVSVDTTNPLGGIMKKDDMKVTLPDRVFVDPTTTPVDVKMISAAVLNKLRHRQDIQYVRMTPQAEQNLTKDGFDYRGFDTKLIDVTGFDVVAIDAQTVEGVVEGVLHFEDFVGRRASTYFAAKYQKTTKGYMVSQAGITIVPPHFPRVQAYFVPAVAFDRATRPFRGFWETYAFALANSYDMRPTQAERQAYEAYQNLSSFKKKSKSKADDKKQELVVMVFCMDRLSEEAAFELKISEKNKSKALLEPGYANENGWVTAVFSGLFELDSWDSPFEIEANYTPQGRNEQLMIGKFFNQKDYSAPKAAVAPVSAPAPAVSAPPAPAPAVAAPAPVMQANEPGPVALGTVFLNPFLKLDARIIQKQLKVKGFYQGTIDGSFGKGSQTALRNFKKTNGLRDNATWDLTTQKRLFAGSDL